MSFFDTPPPSLPDTHHTFENRLLVGGAFQDVLIYNTSLLTQEVPRASTMISGSIRGLVGNSHHDMALLTDTLLAVSSSARVEIVDLVTRTQLRTCKRTTSATPTCLSRILSSGHVSRPTFATGIRRSQVLVLWDARTGSVLHEYPNMGFIVRCIADYPSRQWLVCSGDPNRSDQRENFAEGSLVMCNLSQDKKFVLNRTTIHAEPYDYGQQGFASHAHGIRDLVAMDDLQLIATAACSGVVKLWDVRSPPNGQVNFDIRVTTPERAHPNPIRVRYLPAKNMIVIMHQREISLVDTRLPDQILKKFFAHDRPCVNFGNLTLMRGSLCQVSEDEFVSGLGDDAVVLTKWNLDGKILQRGLQNQVTSLCSPSRDAVMISFKSDVSMLTDRREEFAASISDFEIVAGCNQIDVPRALLVTSQKVQGVIRDLNVNSFDIADDFVGPVGDDDPVLVPLLLGVRRTISNAQLYFLFRIFAGLGLMDHAYVLCRGLRIIDDLEEVVQILVGALKVEKLGRSEEEETEGEDASKNLSSPFILECLNVLKHRFLANQKPTYLVARFEDLGILEIVTNHTICPTRTNEFFGFGDRKESRIPKNWFQAAQLLLKHLLTTKELADVRLRTKVDSQVFRAHLAVLVFRTNFFHQIAHFGGLEMSDLQSEDSEMVIDNLSGPCLEALLQFAYVGTIRAEGFDVLFPLMQHAHQYGEVELRKFLLSRIWSVTTEHECDGIFEEELEPVAHYLFNDEAFAEVKAYWTTAETGDEPTMTSEELEEVMQRSKASHEMKQREEIEGE